MDAFYLFRNMKRFLPDVQLTQEVDTQPLYRDYILPPSTPVLQLPRPPPALHCHTRSEGCVNTGHGMPSNHTQYMFFFATFASFYLWGR